MASGDGLLVRVPVAFGQASAEAVRGVARLAQEYGNGHVDLSLRGNLQIRGVSESSYPALRVGLADLGFTHSPPLAIIASPLVGIDKNCAQNVREIVDGILAIFPCRPQNLPEKFLLVVDGGGSFPLASLPCDLYVKAEKANVAEIVEAIDKATKCHKKPADEKAKLPAIGYLPVGGGGDEKNILCIAASFGRMSAGEMLKLADIAEIYADGVIIFAPFRRIILPAVKKGQQDKVLEAARAAGFVVDAGDARLNIHACVGAPECSSAQGETRHYAAKYAKNHPDLKQTVHIMGCPKACAYAGRSDITITASNKGYEIKYEQ